MFRRDTGFSLSRAIATTSKNAGGQRLHQPLPETSLSPCHPDAEASPGEIPLTDASEQLIPKLFSAASARAILVKGQRFKQTPVSDVRASWLRVSARYLKSFLKAGSPLSCPITGSDRGMFMASVAPLEGLLLARRYPMFCWFSVILSTDRCPCRETDCSRRRPFHVSRACRLRHTC